MNITSHKYYLRFLLLALLLNISCEKVYKWEIKPTGKDVLVVDGIITNEYKPQCIKLSLLNHGINLPIRPLSNAIVSVNDGTASVQFTESPTEPGSYYSIPFQGVVGKKYNLQINYQSATFKASASMESITPFDTIKLIKEKGLYRYNHVKYGNPAMLEVYLDWSSAPYYCNMYGSCNALETFYILYNIDVNSELGPDKETIYFPVGTKIIRRKYSLTAEHQAYLRSLLMETEWRGGIFDVQQGNVNTNLNNGALGFFGACMVLMDTTIVK